MHLLPFFATLALVLVAFAIRIARPPIDPPRWNTVVVTITANTAAFVAAMTAAAEATRNFEESLRRVNEAMRR